MSAHTYGLRTNPPRPTLDESRWRVRSNETPLGPSWSNWYVDVVRMMWPTVLTDTDLNAYRIDHGRWIRFISRKELLGALHAGGWEVREVFDDIVMFGRGEDEIWVAQTTTYVGRGTVLELSLFDWWVWSLHAGAGIDDDDTRACEGTDGGR
jgi:hypothetical protein